MLRSFDGAAGFRPVDMRRLPQPRRELGQARRLLPGRLVSWVDQRATQTLPAQREKFYVTGIQALSSLSSVNRPGLLSDVRAAISQVRQDAIENAARVMLALALPSYFFHRQGLLVWGIHVEGQDHRLAVSTPLRGFAEHVRYRRFELAFEAAGTSGLDWVPLRTIQRAAGQTPYVYTREGNIEYHGLPLRFDSLQVRQTQLEKIFHGFYFPHLKPGIPVTDEAYSEIRISPRNRRKCPGRCKFCERVHELPTEEELAGKHDLSPDELVDMIVQQYPDVLPKVKKAKIVTELWGSEKKAVAYMTTLSSLMRARGFSGHFVYVGEEVRSQHGLNALVQHGFSTLTYPLEAFSNRGVLMSPIKSISLSGVIEILRNTNSAGFTKIGVAVIEGLDTVGDFMVGMNRLVEGVPMRDRIGNNAFIPFASYMEALRVPEAWDIEYYRLIAEYLDGLGLIVHSPKAFEKGSVFGFSEVSTDYNEERASRREPLSPEFVSSLVSGTGHFKNP